MGIKAKLVKKAVSFAATLAVAVSTLATAVVTNPVEVQAATSVSGVSTVSNMTSDFARGVDISEVIALEKSGASYKYLDGTTGDIFDILAGAGVNYVRIRIWNNPYDSSSSTGYKGYGAGNCDLYNAKVLGKRATDAGMKVFIDFHYSDFWCDPEKQYAPKAWKDYSLAYKKDALYNFTYDSLSELLDYGVNIGMVQIGNETNGAMCGVGGNYDNVWDLSSGVGALMQQGCYAVDDINKNYSKSILKALHFTDLNERGEWYASCADKLGIDYDVFATSYYPMWHGTASSLQSTLTNIAKTYGKKVMVAEVANPYTFDNGDTEGNNVTSKEWMNFSEYDISVSGQAQSLRDVFASVAAVNKTVAGAGIGAFYWAPEWIAVDSSTWGSNGSGWASSTSGNYEKLYQSDVTYFSSYDRGSSWDNMTLFDKNGTAMKSLYVFNDIAGKSSKTSSGTSTNVLDGTYYIKNKFSGKYLDVEMVHLQTTQMYSSMLTTDAMHRNSNWFLQETDTTTSTQEHLDIQKLLTLQERAQQTTQTSCSTHTREQTTRNSSSQNSLTEPMPSRQKYLEATLAWMFTDGAQQTVEISLSTDTGVEIASSGF